ncbi:hypothetical protein TrVFT333_000803 [Trichoderma virens FT-333]|nr:hypothetical protein TrVFT333_000803 [Trichoderma virens FT-333]
MAPQGSENGQQNEFSAPWPQHSQLQMSPGDAFGTFSSLGLDTFADSVFSGYNTAISGAHRQYPSTTSRYQHLDLAHLLSSDYVTTDTAAHSSLQSSHSRTEITIPALSNIQNGSDGTSIAPRSSSATTTATAEGDHDTSLDVPSTLHAPMIPLAQRRSRARKPASEEWESHKRTIEHSYIKQNLSLIETMKEMKATHQFYATEKMYKDMFKQWKWSKNLPRDMAIGMLNKAKRRQPKQSIFQWGNQTWTVDRIKKTHGKLADQPDANSLAGGPIDEGPFRLSLNQSSIADLSSFVKKALEADKDGDEEEAEWGLRDALSCSSRLLSPTHEDTVNIGYILADFYASKKNFVGAYDILNWMTNKHLGGLEESVIKGLEHMFHTISFLRRWLKYKEAELLIYRLLKSLKDSERYPVIPLISTGLETVSDEMIGELLSSVDEKRLTVFLYVLQDLARDSQNHKFLQDLMPQIIERCDGFQQTNSNLAIHSRCILSEILVHGAQYERACSILAGSGRSLKDKVDSKSLLEFSTLKLVQRIAVIFLRANDPEMYDKVIKRVVTVFDTDFAAEGKGHHGIMLMDFLISTTFEVQKRCEWERICPWIERALSLAYSLLGQQHPQTRRIEEMLETHNIEQLFLMETMRSFQEYLLTLNRPNTLFAL